MKDILFSSDVSQIPKTLIIKKVKQTSLMMIKISEVL
jgi:hypothetical protein